MIRYYYNSRSYETLSEAKAAGQAHLTWLSQNPREHMQVKAVTKTGPNTYSMDGGDGLTNEEILANPEGVFLCSGEAKGELKEVTDLALEVQESKNLWIDYQGLANVVEYTATLNEDGTETESETLHPVSS
jgi:hypothetical protein